MKRVTLKMLSLDQYAGVDRDDPIRFYRYPVVGSIYRRRIELCLAELHGGDRILEVGFGSGVAFLNLAEQYKEIYGLDLKADITEVSEVFAKSGIQVFLVNGTVLSMPYPDNYFDSVLLISILEHLKPEDQPAAFREIRRVLKKGGQVVYGVPSHTYFMNIAFRLLGFDSGKFHLSRPAEISSAAKSVLKEVKVSAMKNWLSGKIYEIGHFIKE